MTKLKIASTAALAALGLASAGLIAAGGGRPEDPRPAMKPAASAKSAIPEVPEPSKPGEAIEVRGKVVAPDGTPVARAVVRAAYIKGDTVPWPEATSGADGRFVIRMPKPIESGSLEYGARYPWLVASAGGTGPGWIEGVLRPDRPAEQVVTLAEEGPPIEGRIVDLEGRPVPRAEVRVASLLFEPRGDIAGWIAGARKGSIGNVYPGLTDLPLGRLVSIVARTGPDGRFHLTGVGRDRIASLLISGPGIANTQAFVLSRDEPEIHLASKPMMSAMTMHVHAPKFQLVVAPGQRVEGTVRDQDTGRPIAGLVITAGLPGPFGASQIPDVESRTDTDGRYRLDGLPRAAAYRVFVKHGPGLPYTDGALDTPAASPGLEPANFDFTLKRGIVVRGKVTDKATGKPAQGNVFYLASADNTHASEYPGFLGYTDFQSAAIEDDGRFEIVALAGHGLLAVKNFGNRYRAATGLEAIRGYDAVMKGFLSSFAPIPASGYNLFAETDLDPKLESVSMDLQLDGGRSATVQVVDPQGRPLGETKVSGLGEVGGPFPTEQESATFEVHALDPSRPRRVVVAHEARKLVGSADLRGDEAGPLTIRLLPWGSVAGRVVDEEGRPRKHIRLVDGGQFRAKGSKPGRPDDRGILPGADGGGTPIGDDGRFRIEGLVPGLKYGAFAVDGGMVRGEVFGDLTINPGEVKDLGDLKVQPPKKTED